MREPLPWGSAEAEVVMMMMMWVEGGWVMVLWLLVVMLKDHRPWVQHRTLWLLVAAVV